MAPETTAENAEAVVHSGSAIFLGFLHAVGLLSLFCKKLWDSVSSVCNKSIFIVVSAVVFLTGMLSSKIFVQDVGNRQKVPKSGYHENCQAVNTAAGMNPVDFSPKAGTEVSSTNQLTPGMRFRNAHVEIMTTAIIQNHCKFQARNHPSYLRPNIVRAKKDVKHTVQNFEQSKVCFKRQKQSVLNLIAAIQYLTFEMSRTPRNAINQQDAIVCTSLVRHLTASNDGHDSGETSVPANETTTGNGTASFENDLLELYEVLLHTNEEYSTGSAEEATTTLSTSWPEQICESDIVTETVYRDGKNDWVLGQSEYWIAVDKNDPAFDENDLVFDENDPVVDENDTVADRGENSSDTCPLTRFENENMQEITMSETDRCAQQHFLPSKQKKKQIMIQALKRIFCPCASFSQPKRNNSWRQENHQEEIEALMRDDRT